MSRKQLIGWCLTPLFIFLTSNVFAQEEQVATSNYFLFHRRNQNFSVQAFLPSGNVSLFTQNQFLIKELCTVSVSGYYNVKGNCIALTTSHFGYSKYGIFTVSGGYTRTFAHRIAFGLQIHYILHHVESYSKLNSLTFDLSLYGKISQKVGIGVSAYNPANFKYGLTGKEKIPMLYMLMLDYKINNKVLLAAAVSKQLPGFFDVSATMCYKDKFYGFISDFSLKKAVLQFSFWWKRAQFDVGGAFDYRLGFSPQINLTYCFK